MPALGVHTPALPLVLPERLRMLDPRFSVPAVLVSVPVNVCVNPAPRFSVPPEPLIVNAPPLTLPVNVAVPAVFVIDTVPVVVKPSMFCADAVPVNVMAALPAVNVPLFMKSP